MIKKPDNLSVGIIILVFTLFPIILITIYEEKTGNRLGYYGVGFIPLLSLSLFLIVSAFIKKENNDE